MGKHIFECSGFKDIVKFRFENGFICIAEKPKKVEYIINESDLTGIKCANYPWMSQCSVMNIELTFIYDGNGRQKTQSVILNNPGKDVTELLDFLKDRYREICFIGPTEKERAEILSPDYTGVVQDALSPYPHPIGSYCRYSPHFYFVLYLMIATTDQAIMTNPGKMNRVGLVILTLTLVPLGMMYLIEKKLFMVVRNGSAAYNRQEVFGQKTLSMG